LKKPPRAGTHGVSINGTAVVVEESFVDGRSCDECPVEENEEPSFHLGSLLSADPWVLLRRLGLPTWTGDSFHSSAEFPGVPRAMDHTTVKKFGGTVVNGDADDAPKLNSQFPCGQTGATGFVRSSDDGAMPLGDYIAVTVVLHGDVPISFSKWYQFAVVFDQDGVEENNFRAREPYTRDWMDNADRLVDVIYHPEHGWLIRSAY
jgi:hypothetical protein